MKTLWNEKTLGVLGAGNMAEALLRGIITGGIIPAPSITVYDILPARQEVFTKLGCTAAETPQAAANSDVILLAVKPQTAEQALKGLTLRPDQLLISIAAGIPTKRLETWLPPHTRIVRVMPNTPLLVGMGASALARGTHATATDMTLAMSLFASSGFAAEVAEDKLDAVTALSGSGPAYVFRFAEALQKSGEDLGLTADLAAELTAATLRGAAEMLARLGNPAKLREQVTSPGGTTAAALKILNDQGFETIINEALAAARNRSIELGR